MPIGEKQEYCRKCDIFFYISQYSACPNCFGVKETRKEQGKKMEMENMTGKYSDEGRVNE